MSLEVLDHAEGPHLLLSKDGDHFLVWLEELLVVRVLELLLLDVGPQPLDHLRPGQGGALLLAQKLGQVVADLERFGESGSLRHLELVVTVSRYIVYIVAVYIRECIEQTLYRRYIVAGDCQAYLSGVSRRPALYNTVSL